MFILLKSLEYDRYLPPRKIHILNQRTSSVLTPGAKARRANVRGLSRSLQGSIKGAESI